MEDRTPVGCRVADDMLEGGLESGIITEIYGEAGSGKTNFCLQAARSTLEKRDGKVILIDTEGISTDRLEQIFRDAEEALDCIISYRPMNMTEQNKVITSDLKKLLSSKEKILLVICDTLTMYYRAMLNTEEEAYAKRMLNEELQVLMSLAHKYNLPVLVTNQVYNDIERNTLKPIGGNILAHSSKTILELIRMPSSLRIAKLRKHRSIKDGAECRFRIVSNGLKSDGD